MNLEKFALTNKVAVVTGGASGIGRAIAIEFAKVGAHVVIFDKNLDASNEVTDKIRALGQKVLFLKGDVRDQKAIDKLVRKSLDHFDRIDILVNNAGRGIETDPHQIGPSEWDSIVGINLTGPFLLSKAVQKVMVAQNYGVMINIGSIAGKYGSPKLVHYASAKAGLSCFTRSLSMAWATHNIRVNCIAPGFILTEGAKVLYKDNPERLEKPPMRSAINRWGRPEEIGLVAVFLASDASSYITGQTLFVDGCPILFE